MYFKDSDFHIPAKANVTTLSCDQGVWHSCYLDIVSTPKFQNLRVITAPSNKVIDLYERAKEEMSLVDKKYIAVHVACFFFSKSIGIPKTHLIRVGVNFFRKIKILFCSLKFFFQCLSRFLEVGKCPIF